MAAQPGNYSRSQTRLTALRPRKYVILVLLETATKIVSQSLLPPRDVGGLP